MTENIVLADIKGCSFHPGAYDKARKMPSNTVLDLRREPNNKYDKNAVAICRGGAMLGHVERGKAGRVAAAMDAGQTVRATKRGFLSLRIDLNYKGQDAAPKAARAEPFPDDKLPI